MIIGLMWMGCAVAIIELALIPTPSFLYDLQAFSHEGMALMTWCGIFAVFGFLASICIDAFGHKRIYAYGLIVALFGAGGMVLAVGLHPHPTGSVFFWVATCVTSLASTTVVVSSYATASAFAGEGMSRKFALGISVSIYSLGVAMGGALSLPVIKEALALILASSVPRLEHARTSAALVLAMAGIILALLTIPLVRKHRKLSKARGGFIKACKPLLQGRFWRLIAFALSWLGAKIPLAYTFYVLPIYLERSGILPSGSAYGGAIVAAVYGTIAVFATPLQILMTTSHPLLAIALGAACSSLSLWWLMWQGGTIWAVVACCTMIAVGEAMWWPRFLGYSSDVTADQVHVGLHMAVAVGIEALSRGIVAVLGPILLGIYCPDAASCRSVPLWGIAAAVTCGWSLIALPLLKVTHDPYIKRAWKQEIKLTTYYDSSKQFNTDDENLPVTLEDSSQDDVASGDIEDFQAD